MYMYSQGFSRRSMKASYEFLEEDREDLSPARDQRFKEIVRDRDILASIIKDVIPEFGHLSREEIYGCLDICKDGHTVRGRNIELVSSDNGPIYMDSVFDVRYPGKGEMSLIVAIEGQGSQMSVSDLHNRQIYYSSRLISDQGRDFPNKNELYRSLRKTTVVWVKLSPNAEERNTIIRDNRYRYSVTDPDRIVPSPLDKTEIIEINVGPYEDGARIELLGILGILFSKDMGEAEKDHSLRAKYHISLRSSIIREAGNMGALAEEYELYGDERERIGIEKGIEKEKTALLEHFARLVIKKHTDSGEQVESIIDSLELPPGYREPLLDLFRNGLFQRDL